MVFEGGLRASITSNHSPVGQLTYDCGEDDGINPNIELGSSRGGVDNP